MLSIYTTENIVTSIFQDSDNRYDAWYDFITKLRPTMNVLLNEDTDYEENDYNGCGERYGWNYCKGVYVSCGKSCKYFGYIADDC